MAGLESHRSRRAILAQPGNYGISFVESVAGPTIMSAAMARTTPAPRHDLHHHYRHDLEAKCLEESLAASPRFGWGLAGSVASFVGALVAVARARP
jgi:hypothetical protein